MGNTTGIIEHPIAVLVREYATAAADSADSAFARQRRATLLKALTGVRAAAAHLHELTTELPWQEMDIERLRPSIGQLLGVQIALWQSLPYVSGPLRPARDVREELVTVMHELGDVIEALAFATDRTLGPELERRLDGVAGEVEPTPDWRDVIDGL